MLAILFWAPPSLIDNLQISMLMVAAKAGPKCYCIHFDDTLEFYSMFELIIYYLLQENMFLYPTYARLGGPSLHEPWLSMARAIQAHPSITQEEYVASFVNF